DFLPRRDLAVLSWSGTFAAQLSGSPGAFGISPADVAQYLAKHDALAAAMQLVDKPETRTSPAVALKNQARAELIAEARALAAILRANRPGTPAQRPALGLPGRDRAVSRT